MARPTKAANETAWRNRIVGSGEEKAADILANPLNWRVHPKAQRIAMKAAFDNVGWIQQVILNKRTNRLIDGHMRVELAKERGESVPVIYVDLSLEEEKLALASIDPIGDMASTDKVALSKLIKDSKQYSDDVEELMDQISAQSRMKAEELIDTSDLPLEGYGVTELPVATLSADAIFSSSNKFDIPDLMPHMLSTQVPHKLWAGKEFGQPDDLTDYLFMKDRLPGEWSPEGAVLGFYVFDKHFEHIWNDCVKNVEELIGAGWGAVLSPDFSVLEDWPFPAKIWNYYRERWMSRFWQECGVPVIPNVMGMYSKDDDWTVATLPTKIPVMSVQVRTAASETHMKKMAVRSLNINIEHCNPDSIIIYGGAESRNWLEPNLPTGVEYVWLSSVAALRAGNRKGTKKRNA